MRVLFAVAGVLALAGATAAWGQPTPLTVTVDELVTRALERHPDLAAGRFDVDAAGARVRQAALRPNPMLDLGGQKAVSPDNTLSAGVTVPLDLNGRREGRIGVAEADVALRRAQLAERARRLVAEIRFKAGELLAARRTLDTTSAMLDVNRQALGLLRERLREGAATAVDERLQLVEVNRLDTAQRTLEARIAVLTAQLAVVAGIPLDTPLSLRDALGAPAPVIDREAALRRATETRPDVVAARMEVALARARVRKEEAEGRWDASVNVGYQRQEMGFDLRGLTDTGATRPIQDVFHFFGAGVSVTLPVRNRNQGNVAAAAAEARAAEQRVALAELTARREVEAAYAQYDGMRRALELYDRGVRDVARENVDVVRQAHALGRGSLLDVIAEQRRYLEIESGYTDTLRQLWDAAVEIDKAVGGTRR